MVDGPLILGSCWPLMPPLMPLLLPPPVGRDTGVPATEWARRCTTPGTPHAVAFGAAFEPHAVGVAAAAAVAPDADAADGSGAAVAALPPS